MPDVFSTVARFSKYFVPQPLRPYFRGKYILAVRSIKNRREKKELNRYLGNGGTYLDWYAKRLDRVSENIPDDYPGERVLAWMATGVDDLNAARKFELKPTSTLHEFGCGQLRAGVHFIKYLNAKNYSANDASKGRLDTGLKSATKILGADELERKAPELIINQDNSFNWVNGKKFDFIWSGAVLPHMPTTDIQTFFDNLKKVMHEASQFLFTFSESEIDAFRSFQHLPSGRQRFDAAHDTAARENTLHVVHALNAARNKDCVEVSVKDWFHSFSFYQDIVTAREYKIEDVSHALPPEPCTSFPMWVRLARITLKG